MTRTETARRLGRSVAWVRRAEARGQLRPHVDGDGVHRFVPRDVEKLAAELGAVPQQTAERSRAGAGELAARAWDILAKGGGVVDVVREVRLHPDAAAELAEKFRSPAHVVLGPAEVAELGSLGFGDELGRVTGATLLAAARRLRQAVRESARARRELERARPSPADSG